MFNPRNRHNHPHSTDEMYHIKPQPEVTRKEQQQRADDAIRRQLRLAYKLKGGRLGQPTNRKES